MKVFEAPNNVIKEDNDVVLFLAGGITGCKNWQKEVIRILEGYNLEHLVICNPRRENFDIHEKDAALKQITWEFENLNKMDIFSMYFANSESVQPICMYELGRHLERMIHRFPFSYQDRILVGIEEGYSRTDDVVIQSHLATNTVLTKTVTPSEYAAEIVNLYNRCLYSRKEVV